MKKINIMILGLSVLAGAVIADTITGNVRVTPNITHNGSGSASSFRETISSLQSWTVAGTTNNTSLTKLWVKHDVLPSSGSTNYDLHTSMNDSFGQAVNFAKVRFFAVVTASSNAAPIGIGGAASGALTNWVGDASDIVKVPQGSGFYLFAPDATGFVVSNGVSDTLAVTNYSSASNAYYDIYIGGLE